MTKKIDKFLDPLRSAKEKSKERIAEIKDKIEDLSKGNIKSTLTQTAYELKKNPKMSNEVSQSRLAQSRQLDAFDQQRRDKIEQHKKLQDGDALKDLELNVWSGAIEEDAVPTPSTDTKVSTGEATPDEATPAARLTLATQAAEPELAPVINATNRFRRS